MTITQDAPRYQDTYRHSTVDGGPTFSGLDIMGGIVAAVMLLLPLTAAATHYSHQGWPAEQSETR
jgi:hypothetical protein